MDNLQNQINNIGIHIDTVVNQYEQYAMCKINEVDFLIFNKENLYDEEVRINLAEYNVIILCPLSSKKTISITAKNILIFDTVNAVGNNTIHASSKLIFFGTLITSDVNNDLRGGRDVCFAAPTQEEREIVVEKFKKGIEEFDGEKLVDGFLITYEVLERQLKMEEDTDDNLVEGERIENNTNPEEGYVDVEECLTFFDIPIRYTNNI